MIHLEQNYLNSCAGLLPIPQSSAFKHCLVSKISLDKSSHGSSNPNGGFPLLDINKYRVLQQGLCLCMGDTRFSWSTGSLCPERVQRDSWDGKELQWAAAHTSAPCRATQFCADTEVFTQKEHHISADPSAAGLLLHDQHESRTARETSAFTRLQLYQDNTQNKHQRNIQRGFVQSVTSIFHSALPALIVRFRTILKEATLSSAQQQVTHTHPSHFVLWQLRVFFKEGLVTAAAASKYIWGLFFAAARGHWALLLLFSGWSLAKHSSHICSGIGCLQQKCNWLYGRSSREVMVAAFCKITGQEAKSP